MLIFMLQIDCAYMLGWVDFLGLLQEIIAAPIRGITVDSGFILKVEPTGYPEIGCKGWKEERFLQYLGPEHLEE